MSKNLYGGHDRVVLYRDNAGQWRWRFRARGNGQVLADSGQGYAKLVDAVASAERVTRRTLTDTPPFWTDLLPAVVWE